MDIKISYTELLARLLFLDIKAETKQATVDAIYAYHTCRSHARGNEGCGNVSKQISIEIKEKSLQCQVFGFVLFFTITEIESRKINVLSFLFRFSNPGLQSNSWNLLHN